MRQVTTKYLSIVLEHLVGAEQKHITNAARLVDCVFHAETRFGGDEFRDFVLTAFGNVRRTIENGRTFIACELRSVGMRCGVHLSHLVQCRFRYRADLLFGVGIVYGDDTITASVRAHFATGNAHSIELMVEYELIDHFFGTLRSNCRSSGKITVRNSEPDRTHRNYGTDDSYRVPAICD